MTIFISHSSLDGDAVRSLVQHIEKSAGKDVWLDQDLTPSEKWWAAILEQIRNCKVFVFALSQNSLSSEPCRAELDYATELGLPILPVQVGDVTDYRNDPIFARQAIDYRNPTVVTGMSLMRALQKAEGEREPLPDPLPTPPKVPYEYLLKIGKTIRDREPISPADQDAMLRQLRQALRDEKDESVRRDIRTALNALRQRPDTTYPTVKEIDELLSDSPAQKADWYPDPYGNPRLLRYWDGQRWTEHTRQQDPFPQPIAPGFTAPQPNPFPQPNPVPTPGPVPSSYVNPFPLPQPEQKTLSIVAFVLAASALLIPFLGIGGIICGGIAMSRKERLGPTSLVVAIVATIVGFIIWSAIVSNSG